MGRWWVLPSAAAGFGIGVLGAARQAGPAWVWGVELAAGLALVGGAAWRSSAEGHPGRTLLASAGLVASPEPLTPRERLLAAAGFPPRPHRRDPGGWSALSVTALVLGTVLAGSGWAGVDAVRSPELGDLRGRAVAFQGVAAGDVRPGEYGWSLEARLASVRPAEGPARRAGFRVWATGTTAPPHVLAGTPLGGMGTLEPVPSGPGFGDYLRARGVAGVLRLSRLSVRGPPRNPLMRLANAVRLGLRRGALVTLPRREAGLLLGLAIGDTDLMDPEVEEDFRATGLGHLLAVSGSNVALFLAPILGALIALRLRRSLRLGVALAAVGFFVLLTRWEPSVLRAALMAALALVGVWAGRPRHTGSILGGAVLALLIADPGLTSSIGFQLSVAATIGLAALASPLAARLRWVPRPVALAMAATLAAQLAVTPLLLLHFGVVPTATIVANLLAFPAVALALFGGIAAAGTALVWEPVGKALGGPATLPLAYLTAVADRTAHLALPSLASTGWGPPVAVLGLVVALGWRIRRGRAPVGMGAAAVAMAVLAWSAVPRAGPPSGLEVIFLDVGQGDAAVIRTPDGATILVDAGPEPDDVATDLARLGVRRLELAVASHAHADHIEGFPAILARHPVDLFLEPGCPAESPSFDRLVEALADESVPVRHPRGGTSFRVGGLLVEVLGPDACAVDSPNDDSLVLRMSYGEDVVLFPGDAEIPAQEDLLDDGDPLDSDVLKVPHHGGDTSTTAFLEATGAGLAVVSTGPNDYGHPVPSVLAALRALGMRVVRTDRLGDITVTFDDGTVLLQSERA